ncbi:complement C1r subcomponent-like [Discoglossus pictus]
MKDKLTLVCGKPENPVISISRIIAGKPAKPGNFPWQVSINTDIGSSAGVLIGEHWVLTAAQVICSVKEEQRYIYMGNVEKKSNLEHHAVEEIHVHPDYNNRTYNNDIALIRLRDPVIMNQNVSPICLPGPDNNILYDTDKMGYVSGFGLNEKGHTSGHLLYVDIPMVSRARCKEYLKRKNSKYAIFTKNMFCAGFPESTIHKGDSCSGDSGGPYASKDQNGTWVVTGLVSWGFVCGKGYGFYTKVSNYLGWIQEYIGV